MNKSLSIAFALAASAALAPAVQAQDVQAGEKKVAMCIGCHGIPAYQASFPEIHKVPMISGQSAKYIVSALTAYQKGERKHGSMRAIAESLSEKDMADIAAFYEQHGGAPAPSPETPPPASAKVAELLTKGACVSCHGANFNKPLDPAYPKIGGQHADYLYVALKSYKTERNAQVGRSNGVMAGQVKQFSNAELKAMANYIGSLPSEVKTVPQSSFR